LVQKGVNNLSLVSGCTAKAGAPAFTIVFHPPECAASLQRGTALDPEEQ